MDSSFIRVPSQVPKIVTAPLYYKKDPLKRGPYFRGATATHPRANEIRAPSLFRVERRLSSGCRTTGRFTACIRFPLGTRGAGLPGSGGWLCKVYAPWLGYIGV